MKGEAVNHPAHYRHPSGVECIEIIRHYICDVANAIKYLWRAGLKSEEGMTRKEKEIEDCRKAVFYLRDYMKNAAKVQRTTVAGASTHPSNIKCETIASCYDDDIAQAFRELWWVGLIIDGVMTRPKNEMTRIVRAIKNIEHHIVNLLENEE